MGNYFFKIEKFSDSMVLELTVDPRVLNTCSLLKEVEDFFLSKLILSFAAISADNFWGEIPILHQYC